MPVMELKQLTKYYGTSRGIEDVTFSVNKGEIFGFIGPNGAGKSTTIRTLLGLIFPTSGSASIFGKDCIQYGSEIRKDIGYLPSEVFYYDKMRVLDVLEYAASFFEGDCSKRIKELTDMMELDVNRRIEDLSYGNKKKVGIVQGLLHFPKLIMLDEPTSGLDPLMQHKFFNLIRQENEKGSTVFFSSHILSEVQQLCHRVAIIKEGKIVKVEDIKSLREDNFKKVTIKGENIPSQLFTMEGITEVNQEEEGVIRFFFKGDINEMIQTISQLHVDDLFLENPTLEEIFMHYYE